MSLYNLMNGVNPATFYVLPMLGKHPEEYPRFRDCFIETRHFEIQNGLPVMVPNEEQPTHPVICVYTRVGGGNRESYTEEIAKLQAMPDYVSDFDDEFDETFATFVFRVPERWIQDYYRVTAEKWIEVSPEYQAEMKRVYPKLEEPLTKLFKEGHL